MIHALLLALTVAAGPDPHALARIAAAAAPAEVKAGASGKLVIDIRATGTADTPSHLELNAPTKVTLVAPSGLELSKDKLAKADAVTWDRKHVRFEVPFTATAAGSHEVSARVEFAVCGEDPKTGKTTICLLQADLGAAKNAWPVTVTVAAKK
jgi:hypothetical protein